MCPAFDDERLAALQRAYDEVLHDLFGNCLPELHIRESIACAVLYSAKAGQEDWERMAAYAGSQALNLLRERALLMRDASGARIPATKVA